MSELEPSNSFDFSRGERVKSSSSSSGSDSVPACPAVPVFCLELVGLPGGFVLPIDEEVLVVGGLSLLG